MGKNARVTDRPERTCVVPLVRARSAAAPSLILLRVLRTRVAVADRSGLFTRPGVRARPWHLRGVCDGYGSATERISQAGLPGTEAISEGMGTKRRMAAKFVGRRPCDSRR